jgi:hypothetical protein
MPELIDPPTKAVAIKMRWGGCRSCRKLRGATLFHNGRRVKNGAGPHALAKLLNRCIKKKV